MALLGFSFQSKGTKKLDYFFSIFWSDDAFFFSSKWKHNEYFHTNTDLTLNEWMNDLALEQNKPSGGVLDRFPSASPRMERIKRGVFAELVSSPKLLHSSRVFSWGLMTTWPCDLVTSWPHVSHVHLNACLLQHMNTLTCPHFIDLTNDSSITHCVCILNSVLCDVANNWFCYIYY